jgi:hypothetical protein
MMIGGEALSAEWGAADKGTFHPWIGCGQDGILRYGSLGKPRYELAASSPSSRGA